MHQQQEVIASKNTNNLNAFNVLKVIAMIGMPFVHILENYETIGVLKNECYHFSTYIFALTVFGPSIFMFCMGLGMAKDTSSKRLFKTGIQMLIISLLFNIVRLTIPGLTAVAVGVASWADLLCNTISSDIYSFVGLFYIFYSIVLRFKPSQAKLLFISAVMLVINIIISSFGCQEVNLLTTLGGHFVSMSYNSFFPLLGWSIYPCLGIFVAKKLINLPTKKFDLVFAIGGLFGFILFLSMVCSIQADVAAVLSEFAYFSYYRWTHAGLILAITFMTLSISYFLFKLFKNNIIINKIASFAPLLLPFYIFQWLGTSLVTAYYSAIHYIITETHLSISAIEYVIISIVVTIACIILTYKKGFSFTRWLYKISDYSRWGKKQSRA